MPAWGRSLAFLQMSSVQSWVLGPVLKLFFFGCFFGCFKLLVFMHNSTTRKHFIIFFFMCIILIGQMQYHLKELFFPLIYQRDKVEKFQPHRKEQMTVLELNLVHKVGYRTSLLNFIMFVQEEQLFFFSSCWLLQTEIGRLFSFFPIWYKECPRL